ncbi:MAG: SMC-Scp complex subunit ScpB [Deltaproteobacteria bacterium]|nr:SMC-Scp complex subunit ScpB [Deltaproteobacteria bacterium]
MTDTEHDDPASNGVDDVVEPLIEEPSAVVDEIVAAPEGPVVVEEVAAAPVEEAVAVVVDVPAEPVLPGVPFVIEEWVFGAVEALCFVSADPITLARAKEVLAGELPSIEGKDGMAPPTTAQAREIFQELLRRWSDPERIVGQGFRLLEIDGGLTFRTQAKNARFIRRMQIGKPQKLSRAALETLSVIAYRQPVTKPQIEEIRGVDCGGALKALLDKRLVRILGKAEDVGRPLLYGTSKTFLDFFNLQSLNDLPTLKQLHELDGGAPVDHGDKDAPAAVVMDLFQKDGPGLISAETEEESEDALLALEKALGEAKKVAKTASTLVFGLEVPDEEPKPTSES